MTDLFSAQRNDDKETENFDIFRGQEFKIFKKMFASENDAMTVPICNLTCKQFSPTVDNLFFAALTFQVMPQLTQHWSKLSVITNTGYNIDRKHTALIIESSLYPCVSISR